MIGGRARSVPYCYDNHGFFVCCFSRLIVSEGLSDDFGFDVEFDSGVLTVDFGKPDSRIMVRPNMATHQVWLSAATTVYKLRWDVVENDFIVDKSDETLKELLAEVISRQVGEDVSL